MIITESERQAYREGFEFCFKKFCECLEVEGIKAPETIRKMNVYRMGVMIGNKENKE